MDEIEVHIERTSGTVSPRRSAPRPASPKVLVGVVVVGVVGLVVWLGSTTPNQAAPIDATTTTEPFPSSTTTTQVAAPAQENPQPVVLKSMPWNEWASDLNANLGTGMAALEGTILLTSIDGDAELRIIQISSTGVRVDQPECTGEPTFQLNGKLGDNLVLESAAGTCLSPRSDLSNGTIIEGLSRGSFLLPVDEDSGWFCTWPDENARLTRYSIDAGLGETYELSGCPLSVTSNAILMETPQVDEIRDQTYSFYWTEPGSTVEPEPIVDECESTGFAKDLLLCRTDSLVEVVSLITGETLTTIASELMPDGAFGFGSTSPDGRYMALSLSDRNGRDPAELPAAVIVDLISGAITDLELPSGNHIQLSWISETQLAVLSQAISACAECASILTVVDITDFSQLFELDFPESSLESWLQLQQ